MGRQAYRMAAHELNTTIAPAKRNTAEQTSRRPSNHLHRHSRTGKGAWRPSCREPPQHVPGWWRAGGHDESRSSCSCVHTQTRPQTVDWGERGPAAAGEERPWLTKSGNQTGGSSAFAPHATRQLEGLGDRGTLVPRPCTCIIAGNHGGLADGVAVWALPSRGSSDRRVVVGMMLLVVVVVVMVVVAATADWGGRRQAIEGASKVGRSCMQLQALDPKPTRRGHGTAAIALPSCFTADTTPVLVLLTSPGRR
ncbi:hypothetical protein GGP41_005228 [Bipolaris sorokiniana]|uniref:Uncharacterized protein n=1 Tax=Cochliobolus sativus TaxID=45130 RepID=A0A8H5ZIK9_COCSA|nr:hypothetical protein GGP41_005228 [Bipolaris sorokiniana]